MSAWDTAEYLLNKSAWGWRTYGELNSWDFVRNGVHEEMRRAGFAAEVRYIGTRPNEQTAEEIDRTYWNFATIDDGRIWDRRNNFFSVQRGNLTPSVRGGVLHYQFGAAPRIDVLKTWPPASITMKMRLGRVWLRHKRVHMNPIVFRIEWEEPVWPYSSWLSVTAYVGLDGGDSDRKRCRVHLVAVNLTLSSKIVAGYTRQPNVREWTDEA
jgi:hypothetical protein